jgi:hypothetical protein
MSFTASCRGVSARTLSTGLLITSATDRSTTMGLSSKGESRILKTAEAVESPPGRMDTSLGEAGDP